MKQPDLQHKLNTQMSLKLHIAKKVQPKSFEKLIIKALPKKNQILTINQNQLSAERGNFASKRLKFGGESHYRNFAHFAVFPLCSLFFSFLGQGCLSFQFLRLRQISTGQIDCAHA